MGRKGIEGNGSKMASIDLEIVSARQIAQQIYNFEGIDLYHLKECYVHITPFFKPNKPLRIMWQIIPFDFDGIL